MSGTTVDREASVGDSLFGGHSGRMLVTISLGTMLLMAARALVSPLLPRIVADLSISTSAAGVALSVMWLMYAVWQYPGGRFADHLSCKTVLVGGLGIGALALLTLSISPTYAVFFFGVALIGVGAGVYPPAAFTRLSELFVERRGAAFGVHSASFDLGGALASVLAVLAISLSNWRLAPLPMIVAIGLLVVALHRWGVEPYRVERVEFSLRKTLRRLLGQPRVRRIVVAFALFSFGYQSVLSFLPTFLQEVKGFSPEFAGNAFAMLFVVGIVVKPVGGRFGDAFGFARASGLGPLSTAAGIAVLLFTDGVPVALVGVFLVALGLAIFYPLMTTYLMNSLPEASRGGDFGAGRTLFYAIGSVGPAFVGFVADWRGYPLAFLALCVCFAACAAVTVYLAWAE